MPETLDVGLQTGNLMTETNPFLACPECGSGGPNCPGTVRSRGGCYWWGRDITTKSFTEDELDYMYKSFVEKDMGGRIPALWQEKWIKDVLVALAPMRVAGAGAGTSMLRRALVHHMMRLEAGDY